MVPALLTHKMSRIPFNTSSLTRNLLFELNTNRRKTADQKFPANFNNAKIGFYRTLNFRSIDNIQGVKKAKFSYLHAK